MLKDPWQTWYGESKSKAEANLCSYKKYVLLRMQYASFKVQYSIHFYIIGYVFDE